MRWALGRQKLTAVASIFYLVKNFRNIYKRVDGAIACLVTDRSGVPIVQVLTDKCPESATRCSFLSMFATATDQASKLGLSKNTKVITMFNSYQVVMFNFLPFVVTIIGLSSANTGLILELESEFSETIEKLKGTVIPRNQFSDNLI